MAIKPISIHMLEDTFICQGRYGSDSDHIWAEPAASKPAPKRAPKLVRAERVEVEPVRKDKRAKA